METFDAEVISITTEQVLQELHKAPLGVLIQNVKNCGSIEDRTLRRLWCAAKRSIEHVEKYLKNVVDEKNGNQGTKPQV